jgi:hypothetical protein
VGRLALSVLPRWSWRISHQVAKVRGSHGLRPRSFSNESFIRACLAIDVDTSIGGRRVAEVLQRLVDTRGKPAMLITDNVLSARRWSGAETEHPSGGSGGRLSGSATTNGAGPVVLRF